VISFFCPKTLNAFLLSLCLPEERNFLAQKTTRKEGFVWSSNRTSSLQQQQQRN